MTKIFNRIITLATLLMFCFNSGKAQDVNISLNGSVFVSNELSSFGTIEFTLSCNNIMNVGVPSGVLDPQSVLISVAVPIEIVLGTPIVTQAQPGFPPPAPVVTNAWSYTPDPANTNAGYFVNDLPIVMGSPIGMYSVIIPYTVTNTILAPGNGMENYSIQAQMMTGLNNVSLDKELSGVITATMTSLPVTFNHFTATAKSCEAQLDWSVAKELGSEQYFVERSADGRQFEAIGQLSYNANVNGEYRFVDEKPLGGNNLYRINVRDADGTQTYSDIQRISTDCEMQNISMFPNPTSSGVKLSGLKAGQRITMYDLTGRMLINTKSFGEEAQLDLSNYAAAMYKVVVTSAEGIVIYNNKVSKQ